MKTMVKKKRSKIDKEILSYDTDDIIEAVDNLGFENDWNYFEKELKSYTLDDKKRLLDELKDMNTPI